MRNYTDPNPTTIKVFVFSETLNRFLARPMTRVVCPECGGTFADMVWYDANRRHTEAGELWVVECPCGEQFTSMDPEL